MRNTRRHAKTTRRHVKNPRRSYLGVYFSFSARVVVAKARCCREGARAPSHFLYSGIQLIDSRTSCFESYMCRGLNTFQYTILWVPYSFLIVDLMYPKTAFTSTKWREPTWVFISCEVGINLSLEERDSGDTPAHLAAGRGQVKVLKLLREARGAAAYTRIY